MVKDPMCGKEVEEKKVNELSEYNGKKYYFCSKECKLRFEMNPEKYQVKVIIRKKKG
ncbi:MAG: YHS domain-containing protein [Thermodesulfobacteriota bacterium]|nr:MAG: YHS domain-containing protein [Thermodesulfobacteriota bacterium]